MTDMPDEIEKLRAELESIARGLMAMDNDPAHARLRDYKLEDYIEGRAAAALERAYAEPTMEEAHEAAAVLQEAYWGSDSRQIAEAQAAALRAFLARRREP